MNGRFVRFEAHDSGGVVLETLEKLAGGPAEFGTSLLSSDGGRPRRVRASSYKRRCVAVRFAATKPCTAARIGCEAENETQTCWRPETPMRRGSSRRTSFVVLGIRVKFRRHREVFSIFRRPLKGHH